MWLDDEANHLQQSWSRRRDGKDPDQTSRKESQDYCLRSSSNSASTADAAQAISAAKRHKYLRQRQLLQSCVGPANYSRMRANCSIAVPQQMRNDLRAGSTTRVLQSSLVASKADADVVKVTSRVGGERLVERAESIVRIVVGSDELSIQARCYRFMALAGSVLAGNQHQELPMKYEDSGKVTRDVAIASMVNEVRASRNLRVGQSVSSSVETVSGQQPAADPWFLAFENTFKDVPAPPPAPPEILPAVLPSISLASGAVNFNNGVPVGGWSNLSVYPNGWFNFVGHFHDSGAPSYNVDFVWSIFRPGGVLIQIGTQGHMAGTFESGSRDFDWNVQQNRPDIAAEWANLSNGYWWRWDAHVQWDVAAAMDSIKRAIQAAQQIVSVIAIIV